MQSSLLHLSDYWTNSLLATWKQFHCRFVSLGFEILKINGINSLAQHAHVVKMCNASQIRFLHWCSLNTLFWEARFLQLVKLFLKKSKSSYSFAWIFLVHRMQMRMLLLVRDGERTVYIIPFIYRAAPFQIGPTTQTTMYVQPINTSPGLIWTQADQNAGLEGQGE